MREDDDRKNEFRSMPAMMLPLKAEVPLRVVLKPEWQAKTDWVQAVWFAVSFMVLGAGLYRLAVALVSQ